MTNHVMNWFFRLVLLLPALSLAALSRAEVNCIVSSEGEQAETAQDLPTCESLYPEARYGSDLKSWRVGISAGYGVRENPLLHGDDLTIYGALQLSWFGERFFFDNGDIGVRLASGRRWDINAITGVGGERAFYSHFNDDAFGFLPGTDGAVDGGPVSSPAPAAPPGEAGEPTVKSQPPSRGLTVDAGLEWLYFGDDIDVQVQAMTDISGRHHGHELWFSMSHNAQYGRWQLVPMAGVVWKSAQATNYFYGVRAHEVSPRIEAYQPGDSVSVFARMGLSYRLSEHWKMLANVQITAFDRSVRRSPWVEKSSADTWYVGVYYEF